MKILFRAISRWSLCCALAVMIAIVFSPSTAHAQSNTYQKGDVLINVGLGYPELVGNNQGILIPVIPADLGVEFAIGDWVGVGPNVGYRSYPVTGSGGERAVRFNFGAEASFHIFPLIEEVMGEPLNAKTDPLDLYVAVIPGLGLNTGEDTSVIPFLAFSWGSYVGCRYYFTEAFALNVKFGTGHLRWGSAGLTLRLTK